MSWGRQLCASALGTLEVQSSLPTVNTIGALLFFGRYAFEWRIEYRAATGVGTSPDPANAELTFRVLTLEVVTDILG
jgi:hypothetical protein